MKSLRVSFVISICLFLTSVGSATDNSFKLDFDGDGRTDLALYREGSRDINIAPQPSYWYFLNTQTGNWGVVHWGRTLDIRHRAITTATARRISEFIDGGISTSATPTNTG
jgi:hypothetical protein